MVVVVVMIVGIGAFVASIAISGFQEYNFLSSQFAQEFQQGASIKSVDFDFARFSNGSMVLSTQFQIPNKMSYPLSFGLSGAVTLGQYEFFSFSHQYPVIMPGKVQEVQISARANLSNSTRYYSILDSMFLSAVDMKANLTASFSIDQLFNFNMVHSSNWTMGPILGQFNISAKAPVVSNNGLDWILPLTVSWNNTTPLNFPSGLSGTITRIPDSFSVGNYGEAYSSINLTAGTNQNTLYFHIPISTFNSLSSGEYSFNLTIGGVSSSVTIPENLTV